MIIFFQHLSSALLLCLLLHFAMGNKVQSASQDNLLAVCLNSPIVCSLTPSITRVLGTPSYASMSDNVSCVSLFFPLGMACTMCSCGHKVEHINFPCVKQSLPQWGSVNESTDNLLYLSILSFVLYH